MKTRAAKKASMTRPPRTVVDKDLRDIRAKEVQALLLEGKGPVILHFVGMKKVRLSRAECSNLLALFKKDLHKLRREEPVMSTQEVADLLNVSRPYVVKLIEEKKLEAFSVGNRRRIRQEDALAFRQKMRGEQKQALEDLADETEKLGINFE